MQLNILFLSYFCEICKCKSISEAADHLFISRQSLSSAMRKLETEIGLPLFVRSNRGICLTKAGEYLFMRSSYIFEYLSQTQYQLEEMRTTQDITIRIGFCPFAMDVNVIRIMTEFSQKHHNVNFDYLQTTSNVCFDGLRDGRFDIALTILPDNREFSFVPVNHADTCIFLSKDNPLASMTNVTLYDLHQEHFLFMKDSFSFRQHFLSCCKESHFMPFSFEIVPSDLSIISDMLIANKGVFPHPSTRSHDFQDSRIHKIILDIPTMDYSLYLTSLKSCKQIPIIEEFKTTLISGLTQNNGIICPQNAGSA